MLFVMGFKHIFPWLVLSNGGDQIPPESHISKHEWAHLLYYITFIDMKEEYFKGYSLMLVLLPLHDLGLGWSWPRLD